MIVHLNIFTSVINKLMHETATYRCDDTRDCVIQFWPPDDEHMCSKHVEAWNKFIVKKNLCIKLVNYWDKNVNEQFAIADLEVYSAV